MGADVDPPLNLTPQDGDRCQRTVEKAKTSRRRRIGAVKRKRKALSPRKATGRVTEKTKPKRGKGRAEGIGETLSTLRRGDGLNPIAGTGGQEHLVPRCVAAEAAATETASEEPAETLTEMLLELQSGDALVVRQKQNISTGCLQHAGSMMDE